MATEYEKSIRKREKYRWCQKSAHLFIKGIKKWNIYKKAVLKSDTMKNKQKKCQKDGAKKNHLFMKMMS